MSSRVFAILAAVSAVLLATLSQTGCTGGSPPTTTTQPASETQPTAPAGHPSVEITSPDEGETITGQQVTITFDTKNIRVTTPGGPPIEGEGHFHVVLDDSEVNIVIENTVTFPVTEGSHTVGVTVVNNDHSVFSPPVQATVNFEVELP